ncbi:sensor histidine kinase [Halobaculum rubrum]|uniref:sensor histidine kinase n=1 Tax=Halobaculum rubrum TaxID=2872158 RepID=UPI001CA45699|nr:HAMP domain-containing sensor histidine kinase [Halobaculum rubrum]QZX99283.1 HAMP domain-containing histidine kinase [Halobaculum rubrum]
MDLRRLMATAIVSVTGLGLAGVAVSSLSSGVPGLPGGIIVGAVLVLGGAFAIAGPMLYRSTVTSDHLLRVAGWNTLGVVVTVAVLALVGTFQAADGGRVAAPLLSGAVIVGVSAFAHVLIGVNDVRRIRARTVADQRRKAAVVNRFVRHDLRHAAQMLIGYSDRIPNGSGGDDAEEATDGGDGANTDVAAKIVSIARQLNETQSRVKVIDELLEGDPDTRASVVVSDSIEERRSSLTDGHPDASLRIDSDGTPAVRGGDHVVTAVVELVENALEHGGDPVDVRVRERRVGDEVEIRVVDDGDGFPADERALINDDEAETQLRHSSGMGLWLSKWVIEFYGGSLTIGTNERGDSEATVRLPVAAGSKSS